MDFLSLCKERYSCRSYQPKAIEKEKLEYVLECARYAPSAVNKQPWRLIIVSGQKHLEALWEAYDREWFRTAPMVIAVCVNKDQAWTRQSDQQNHAIVDGSIITEHICLAAASQGLGTCWICNFDPKICHEALSIPENEEIIALVPIGYPADHPKPKSRKPLAELITKI